ncbi:MAG: hypothetical protein H7175_28255 [Burkholderiales bacterium]|nr:hypothetical protein [Anaerolineae bacterium]
MSIVVFHTDLTVQPSILAKYVIAWREGMTAFEAIQKTLGNDMAKRVSHDLAIDNRDLVVSWYNKDTDETSDYGGVGSLDWEVPNNSAITVSYDHNTTISQTQEDEYMTWWEQNWDDGDFD